MTQEEKDIVAVIKWIDSMGGRYTAGGVCLKKDKYGIEEAEFSFLDGEDWMGQAADWVRGQIPMKGEDV